MHSAVPAPKRIAAASLPQVLGLACLVASPPIAHAAASSTEPSPIDTTVEPDVLGGLQAPLGKWSDAAAVYFGSEAGCTGTLVAPDVVLTAGHCIGGITQVKVGTNDWASDAGETIPVIDETYHPGQYDVGVLVLARPSVYQPRVIATGCVIERSMAVGAPVAIVGFGATDAYASQYTSMQMEAQSTITDPDCTGGRGCTASISPGGELGAGGGGIDSCNGDSGGPLYLLEENYAYLIGVTSRAYQDASVPCSEGGIYTRADAIIEWIESTTGRTLPRATCNLAPVPTGDETHLEAESGIMVSTRVQPHDPDVADTHTFVPGTPPLHGDFGTEPDGSVHYRSHEGYIGPDSFTIVVTDSGVPAMSATVQFTVDVVEDTGGCGCRTGNSPPLSTGLLIALAMWLPLARRGRRAQC